MRFGELKEPIINNEKVEEINSKKREREPIDKEQLYNKDMYRNIPMTDRSAEVYYQLFGLEKPEDIKKYFKDRVVLDLGAGSGELVEDLESKHITDKAFAVDFLYNIIKEDIPKLGFGKLPPKEKRICARLEELPIEDNSVDIVVASKSMPLYAETKEDIIDFFNEIVRVLKSGGEARVSPVKNFNQWMAKPTNLKEKLFPKKRLPDVDRWTADSEAKRLGLSSGYEYLLYLRDKYNKAEEWVEECIAELKKNQDIEVEVVSSKNVKSAPEIKKGKDILIIRKK